MRVISGNVTHIGDIPVVDLSSVNLAKSAHGMTIYHG